MTAYQVTFYHDEPEEASANSFTLTEPYKTVAAAIRGARANGCNAYWQTASIHKGTYHPGQWGIEPPWFEDDEHATPVRVGSDWVER